MQNVKEIFIKLLSAYINREKLYLDKEIDWKGIYHLASIHNVQGIIAAVVNNNNMQLPDVIHKKLQKDFYSTLLYSVRQEKESVEILNILNKFNIKHIMTKGYIIRNYYVDKDLRTMGDIDILVSGEDFEKTKKILQDNGYKITSTYFSEISFCKNNVYFEIHNKLLEENLGNGYDYGSYFNTLCKKAKKIRGNTYELDINDHLIYLIAHIGKHFYNEGCGIRMILDIAVYVKKFENELNWDYLWNELEKTILKRFAENIFFICNKWFKTGINVPVMDAELYEKIECYILDAGTYGFYDRNTGVKLLRKSYGSGAQGNILTWIFPKDKDMRELNEWYRDKPVIFLPIAWIKRWIHSFSNKGWSVVSKMFGAISGKDKARKEYLILKELGIYQNES